MLFRLTAILLGFTPFLLVESVLRMAELGAPAFRDDPFAGFFHARRLFVPSADGQRYVISPARYRFFQPDSFPSVKPQRSFRIFVLGGSTVQGRPFSIDTSFSRWLQIGLRSADPRRQWRVVNCGGISYASYRLVPILEEVLEFQPDLIIVYTGHNEFLEDRSYAKLRRRPAVITGSYFLADRLRTYGVLEQAWDGFRDRLGGGRTHAPSIFSDEVEARLDFRHGLDAYHRDDAWRRDVIAHYAYNLQRMVRLAREAGVPLLLLNPVSNLRDCRPFKSEYSAGLRPQAVERVLKLCVAARSVSGVSKSRAIDLYRQALAIDDRYAQIHFQLAGCYEALGDEAAAKEAYLRAKDEDICPLRMLEEQHRCLLTVAERAEVPTVDVRRLFEGLSRGGIPGRAWLIDHVHPTMVGHQRIADAILDHLIGVGTVKPIGRWREAIEAAYAQHLASLSPSYFATGMKRLERLRRWTQGLATRRRRDGLPGPDYSLGRR